MSGMSHLFRHGSRRLFLTVAAAGLCGFALLAISLSQSGHAAYPGGNGKITFAGGDAYKWSIWTANADGTAPTSLTGGSDDFAPSYSADGSRIAFNRENSIFVMNADGSAQVQLTHGEESNETHNTWVHEYDIPNSNPPETVEWAKVQTQKEKSRGYFQPSFSPDGTQLAVADSNYESTFEMICAVENEGDDDCIDYDEPDAYFHYDYDCNNCTERIVTISSTTGALVSQVTPAVNQSSDYSPAYSVNGTIVFDRSAESSGASGIFVVAPGGAPTQITSGYGDSSPQFSPNGTQVLVRHSTNEMGILPATGGPMTILSPPAAPSGTHSSISDPAFSPDGTQVVFRRTVSDSGSLREQGLYTMGVNGLGYRPVTQGFEPNWQPVPPPPPAPAPVIKSKVKAKKGKIKLDKKNSAVVGTITCGSSPCTLKTTLSKLKVGKKKCGVQTKGPKKLAAKASGKVKTTVKGKCLTQLKEAGKGGLEAKIQITSATGKETLKLKSTLVPAPEKPKKAKGKKGKGGK